jgi:chorismate mutase
MTDRLSSARAKIDSIDRRLAALLARRFALAAALGGLKKTITDKPRERRVLANARRNAGRVYAAPAAAVFAEVIRQSKKLQFK